MKKTIYILGVLVFLLQMNAYPQFENLFNSKKKKSEESKAPAAPVEKTTYEKFLSYCKNSIVNAIFSKTPITATSLPSSPQKYSFSGTDKIYCRFIFDKPLNQTELIFLDGKVEDEYNVDIFRLLEENKKYDDEIRTWCRYPLSSEEINLNYLDVEIWPDVVNNKNDMDIKPAKYISERTGKYQYRVALPCYCKSGFKFFCYGDFEYETTSETAKQYQSELLVLSEIVKKRKEAAKLQAKHEEEIKDSLKIDQLVIPAYFYKQSTFTDPELSITNIRKTLKEKEDWIAQIISLGIQDGETNWTIEYDKSMIPAQPIRKRTTRDIYLTLKGTDGKCFYGVCFMVKDYLNGENRYGKMYPKFYDGRVDRIPCYKVVK